MRSIRVGGRTLARVVVQSSFGEKERARERSSFEKRQHLQKRHASQSNYRAWFSRQQTTRKNKPYSTDLKRSYSH
jgi:hypothetical protein